MARSKQMCQAEVDQALLKHRRAPYTDPYTDLYSDFYLWDQAMLEWDEDGSGTLDAVRVWCERGARCVCVLWGCL